MYSVRVYYGDKLKEASIEEGSKFSFGNNKN